MLFTMCLTMLFTTYYLQCAYQLFVYDCIVEDLCSEIFGILLVLANCEFLA